jgi:hypothetical protein
MVRGEAMEFSPELRERALRLGGERKAIRRLMGGNPIGSREDWPLCLNAPKMDSPKERYLGKEAGAC